MRWLPGHLPDETLRSYLLRDSDLNGWMLMPTSNPLVGFVARNHQALAQKFVLVTSSWETTVKYLDKTLTYEVALHAGVAFPETLGPATEQ